MKTITNQWFLLCFENLEVLGRATGISLGRWGLLWEALGPWAVGGAWEVPEESLGFFEGP